MFLLDVRAEIQPEHDHALNEWYYTHVPRLVSIPGYVSGRRYLSLTAGPSYAALYEIENASFLPSLLGADADRRHPLTLSEWAEWDARFVPYMTHCTTNLYESAAGAGRVLLTNAPIVEFRFDTYREQDSMLQQFCDDVLLPELRSRQTTLGAVRLKAATASVVQWLGTHPRHLLLIQVRDEAAARALTGEEVVGALHEQGAKGEIESVAYAQIARHWPYVKEPMP